MRQKNIWFDPGPKYEWMKGNRIQLQCFHLAYIHPALMAAFRSHLELILFLGIFMGHVMTLFWPININVYALLKNLTWLLDYIPFVAQLTYILVARNYFIAFQITTTHILMLQIPFPKGLLLEFVLNTQNHFWSRNTGCAFSNLWVVLKMSWSQFCLFIGHERRRVTFCHLPVGFGMEWATLMKCKSLALNKSSFSLTPHLLGLKKTASHSSGAGRQKKGPA